MYCSGSSGLGKVGPEVLQGGFRFVVRRAQSCYDQSKLGVAQRQVEGCQKLSIGRLGLWQGRLRATSYARKFELVHTVSTERTTFRVGLEATNWRPGSANIEEWSSCCVSLGSGEFLVSDIPDSLNGSVLSNRGRRAALSSAQKIQLRTISH